MKDLVEQLRHNMSYSLVKFTYTKKNGETREAVGTLCSKLIEEYGGKLPNGTGTVATGTVPYWDVNSGEWRCFKEELLVSAELDNMGELF